MSKETVNYKVYLCVTGYEPEIRRITIDQDISRNYFYLRQKLVTIFPTLKDTTFTVSWRDREGDDIRICSDDELSIALTEMEAEGFKKIYVSAIPQLGSEGPIHPNIRCGSCNLPIQGFRYKCVVCVNFDLCADCERAQQHPDHPFIRIPLPLALDEQFSRKFFQKMCKHMESLYLASERWERKARGDCKDKRGGQPKSGCSVSGGHDPLAQLFSFLGSQGFPTEEPGREPPPPPPSQGQQPPQSQPQGGKPSAANQPPTLGGVEDPNTFCEILRQGFSHFLEPLGNDVEVHVMHPANNHYANQAAGISGSQTQPPHQAQPPQAQHPQAQHPLGPSRLISTAYVHPHPILQPHPLPYNYPCHDAPCRQPMRINRISFLQEFPGNEGSPVHLKTYQLVSDPVPHEDGKIPASQTQPIPSAKAQPTHLQQTQPIPQTQHHIYQSRVQPTPQQQPQQTQQQPQQTQQQPQPIARPQPQPIARPQPQPIARPQPQPIARPQTQPPIARPQTQPITRPQTQSIPFPQSQSFNFPQSQSIPFSQSQSIPFPQSQSIHFMQPQPISFPQTQPIPLPQTQPIPLPQTQPIPSPETQPIPPPETQAIPLPQSQAIPLPQSQAIPLPQSQAIPLPQSQAIPLPPSQAIPLPPSQAIPLYLQETQAPEVDQNPPAPSVMPDAEPPKTEQQNAQPPKAKVAKNSSKSKYTLKEKKDMSPPPVLDNSWTVIQGQEVQEAGAGGDSQTESVATQSLYPKPESYHDTSSSHEIPVKPVTSSGQSPIDTVVTQLISMGFVDSEGWLRQLVEERKGNLDEVLQFLTPYNPAIQPNEGN